MARRQDNGKRFIVNIIGCYIVESYSSQLVQIGIKMRNKMDVHKYAFEANLVNVTEKELIKLLKCYKAKCYNNVKVKIEKDNDNCN